MKIRQSVYEACGIDGTNKNANHQLPMGTILKEQYLIGKVLGQGGFGITYLSWDLVLDIPTAIKEYFPSKLVMRETSVSLDVISYSGDADRIFENNKKRFMREAKTLAKFSHVPEIVQVKNLFQANGTVYIVMEYVEGINLTEFVNENENRRSFEQTFHLLKPVMEALNSVHHAGYVHRDISPGNIMIMPEGSAKLLDFGAVRDVEFADVNSPLNTSTEAIVKPGFAPLEQYQSRGSLGPWSDVYGLCATIYFCLTGTVPPSSLERLLEEKEILFEELEISGDIANVLRRGMALTAAERIGSVDQLLKELSAFYEEPSGVSEGSEPVYTRTPAWKYLFLGFLSIVIAGSILAGPAETDRKASDQETPVFQSEAVMPSEGEMMIYEGQCGNEAYYSFEPETGRLTIFGKGEMDDYNGVWQNEPKNLWPPDPELGFAPWAEFGTSITSVCIQDGITRIGDNAFENIDSLQRIEIGKDLKSIGIQAFLSTQIKEVILPEGFESIETAAFNHCARLNKVILPESLKLLQPRTFIDCISLDTVILGDETEIMENAFACDDHENRWCVKNVVIYTTPGSFSETCAVKSGYNCKEKNLSD